VQLPQMLKAAIEQKQQVEQESLRMSFILQKEKQEAERKRIEAQGIADFQRIVAAGISQQLLEWKGIEATEKLAASSNTKIVVIGSGKNGLPLILGGNGRRAAREETCLKVATWRNRFSLRNGAFRHNSRSYRLTLLLRNFL
jgi:regulator of protease activity HflC (stomatin/prohibitin superfamily)